MSSLKASSAVFEYDLDASFSSRATVSSAPKYYRIDWEGVDLPRRPSLNLADDEYFFELISSDNYGESEKKNNRFFDFISKAGNIYDSKSYRALAKQQQSRKVSAKKHTPVPMHVRRSEIELVSRKLPRFPSKINLSEPSFYPFGSCDLFKTRERIHEASSAILIEDATDSSSYVEMDIEDTSTTEIEVECSEDEEDRDLPRMEERRKVMFSEQSNEDDTSSTDIEIEYMEDGDELFSDESYYSDSDYTSCEDEVEMEVDDIFEELLQIKLIYSQKIERDDPQLPILRAVSDDLEGSMNSKVDENGEGKIDKEVDKNDEGIIDSEMDENDEGMVYSETDESSRDYVYQTTCPLIPVPDQYFNDDDIYELRIGVVRPEIRVMIFQARMELRCRKVSEEHIKKFKPCLAQALLKGRATRLDEYTIEARGRKYMKYDDSILPSTVWVKGAETVSLPTLHDPSRPQFLIFKEAVALGGIKALKPKITMNYDPFASTQIFDDEEVDVDDTNTHKRMRTKHLTDLWLQEDPRDRWSDDDSDEESVHYDSLDDVELPTSRCPVYVCVTSSAKATEEELRERLARQVAEAVWERRYRLERPRAKQRIKYRCVCKFCKTYSPYQTVAYRKRWLIDQNLLEETSSDDPMKRMEPKSTKEESSVVDDIDETDLNTAEPPPDDPLEEMEQKATKEQSPVVDAIDEIDLNATRPPPYDPMEEIEPKAMKEEAMVVNAIDETDLDTMERTLDNKRRKKNQQWMMQWKKPISTRRIDPMEEIIELKKIKEESTMDDAIEEMDLKRTSIQTVSTRKLSIDGSSHFDLQKDDDDVSDPISVDTRSSSDVPQSHRIALEDVQIIENKTSVIFEAADEDSIRSETLSMGMDGASSPPEMLQEIQDKKNNRKRNTFVRGLQSALGLKPSEKIKKPPKKSKRSMKNDIKSLFSNSSDNAETSNPVGFARAA